MRIRSSRKGDNVVITENIKIFVEEIMKDEGLKAKIEALDDKDDAIEQVIAIAGERGYTLTEEDFSALTEKDFETLAGESLEESGDGELSLDDLDGVAGGAPDWLRYIVSSHRTWSQMHQQ